MAPTKPKAAKAAKPDPSPGDQQMAELLDGMDQAPAKGKGGRPTKCTPALLEKIETLMVHGAEAEAAVLAVGISRDSKSRWEDRGRADIAKKKPTIFAEFCLLLDRAPAIALVAVDVAQHRIAAAGDTAAAKVVYTRLNAPGFRPQNNVSLFPPGEIADDDDTLRAELAKRIAGKAQGTDAGSAAG